MKTELITEVLVMMRRGYHNCYIESELGSRGEDLNEVKLAIIAAEKILKN